MTDGHRLDAGRWRALGLLLLLALGLRVVGLVRPCLSDDEATYSVVDSELRAGKVLYRDVVDHKPPGVYLVYAATQAIGGPVGGMGVLHLVLIGVVFATAPTSGSIMNSSQLAASASTSTSVVV